MTKRHKLLDFETDNYYFFYGEYCSQWYSCTFMIDGIKYNCSEQYMMHKKAMLFLDFEAAEAIMATDDPALQKFIGRSVQNFDSQKWNEISRLVVYRGNLAKFGQNVHLWQKLSGTGNKIIVEASPFDRVWGIGLGLEHGKELEDMSLWDGTNWLGEAIMQVRSDLRALGADSV
jgi:ribA/ribD-fused uncharacterized protein